MLAAYVTQHGGPETVEIWELPEPNLGPEDVIVAIEFAAMNFPDLLMMSDAYQVRVAVPYVPGSEFAGRIVAVGEHVSHRRVGDAVFGAAMAGAFAERICVPASAVSPVPPGLSIRDAAGFGVSYRTAYSALKRAGSVAPCEWVVVLGASGSVGTASIDIAHAMGAHVVAVASSNEKLSVCADRGAEALVCSTVESVRDAIRERTGGGADVVIDLIGGASSEQALRALRYGGRFVTVGYASGEIPKFALNLLLVKGIQVHGYDIRLHTERAPDEVALDQAELNTLVVKHGIRPHIGQEFPLSCIRECFVTVASRTTTGKTLICMP